MSTKDGSTKVQRELESSEWAASNERRFGPPGWSALCPGKGDRQPKSKKRFTELERGSQGAIDSAEVDPNSSKARQTHMEAVPCCSCSLCC